MIGDDSHHMVKLITTSVVRGSEQGESHGGVYIIDVEGQDVHQVIDWDTTDIDWQGRGWDRGLRGIAIDGKTVFFVDTDALLACFDSGISEDLVKKLAKRKSLRAVFRDDAFGSDSVKINVEQIFKTLSPSTEVKSI